MLDRVEHGASPGRSSLHFRNAPICFLQPAVADMTTLSRIKVFNYPTVGQ